MKKAGRTVFCPCAEPFAAGPFEQLKSKREGKRIYTKPNARGFEVPDDFITHLGVVRLILMRKCVKGDYTERQFRGLFGVMLKCAGEEYGATPERMASLEAMNQLVQ